MSTPKGQLVTGPTGPSARANPLRGFIERVLVPVLAARWAQHTAAKNESVSAGSSSEEPPGPGMPLGPILPAVEQAQSR